MKKNRPRARKLRRKELGLPPAKPQRRRGLLSSGFGRMADRLDQFVGSTPAPSMAGFGSAISITPIRRPTGRNQ